MVVLILYQYDIKYVTKYNTKFKSAVNTALYEWT